MPANRPAEPVRRRCYIILCTPAPRRKQPRRPALGDDFNIEGESVDSSALQRELARRVEARRASGAYSPEVESLLAERLPDEEEFGKLPAIAELDYAATRAMSSWEVSAAYPIDTEKGGPLRPMVLFAKRFARLW